MNTIGDIYMSADQHPHLVIDCREMKNKVYMFYLLNMDSGQIHTWLEPHGQQLAPSYWKYLG